MSSTNEEIPAPPKPKTSPLEFRNTDLVSRLLAATPPYLYNMPLVPHSYFFSEMLRSLVQGKTEAAARMPTAVPHRRSRKRTWSHSRPESYNLKQMSPGLKCDNSDMPPPIWTPKLTEKQDIFDGKLVSERPLELTMNKIAMNNNTTKLCHTETQPSDIRSEVRSDDLSGHKSGVNQSVLMGSEKVDLSPSGHVPMMFPSMPNLAQEPNASASDLILPPPPPIWYPPLYPAPYGIDPLHFFIDLRVSGHIYDRKNAKDHMNIPPHGGNHMVGNPLGALDVSSASSTMTSSSVSESINNFGSRESLVKQSRHTSAFTVPTPSLARNDPLNLSGNKYHPAKISRYGEEKPAKFDIKSMGFDTNANCQSTNYILKNLSRIYKDVFAMKHEREGIDLTSPKLENEKEEVSVKDESPEKPEEKDGEKEKKCKDLSALIGLELVVDYVKHEVKPGKQSSSEDSSTDVDSNVSSPAVEVVTIPDVDNKI